MFKVVRGIKPTRSPRCHRLSSQVQGPSFQLALHVYYIIALRRVSWGRRFKSPAAVPNRCVNILTASMTRRCYMARTSGDRGHLQLNCPDVVSVKSCRSNRVLSESWKRFGLFGSFAISYRTTMIDWQDISIDGTLFMLSCVWGSFCATIEYLLLIECTAQSCSDHPYDVPSGASATMLRCAQRKHRY